MYAKGEGVAQNDAEAAKWYTKAAEQGDADAQYLLGEMYISGQGVKASDEKAIQWLRKAAKQGHAKAQKRLKDAGIEY
jgi:TPR repeat protein